MNKERTDEREAKEIVEQRLIIPFEHADVNGEVDYLSRDGKHALEITRVTDGRRIAGRKALDESRTTGASGSALRTCWLAVAPDTQHGLKSFLQSVHPVIVQLEEFGETHFDRQRASLHVIARGPLADIYRSLLAAGVERASAVPNHAHREHTHSVIAALASGGSASGSDEALDLLAETLDLKKDNPQKLAATARPNRHLFVWLDDDTQFNIQRPLSHDAPSWHRGFGLPSTAPALDPAITHLWIVHERSRGSVR